MADKPSESEGIVHVPETPDGVSPDPKTVEELRKEQEAEWAAYVAQAPIYVDGVRAFNRGDAVPTSQVEERGYVDEGLVVKRSTKAGQAITNP